jgi:hypothetical protein
VLLNTVSLNNILRFICFSIPSVTFQSTLHLFSVFFCTGSEVLTVMRLHNVVWTRTPCSLVLGCEYFGGALWVFFHRQSEDGGSMA